MRKLKYVWKIARDRWLRPYDDIIIRFNTKALEGDTLVWRIIINGNEYLASGFSISGYVEDVKSLENGVTKYNVGCKGRVRWSGSEANIITARPDRDILL